MGLKMNWVKDNSGQPNLESADLQYEPKSKGNPHLEQVAAEVRFHVTDIRRSIQWVRRVLFWAQCEGRDDLVERIEAELASLRTLTE